MRGPAKSSGVGLSSSSFKDTLSEFIADHSGSSRSEDTNPFGWVDIIEFCRSPYYLDIKPYPWQALMLKIIYMGSSGNRNLVVTNDPELCCENCVLFAEDVGNFDHPCMHCSACPHEKLVSRLYSMREKLKELQANSDQEGIDALGYSIDDVEDNPREDKPLHFECELATCDKCVWDGIDNIGMRSPCLTCKLWPREKLEEFIERKRDLLIKAQVDGEDLLNREKTFNFDTEMMLIYKDLPQDSDARRGGSVRQQVLDKIGKDFREVLLVLGRRSGKALALDTPILTTNGWKTMGEIEIGDQVFGHDGQPAKVVVTSEIMEDRPCYEITFSNGEVIVCDEQHEWPTIDQRERKNSRRNGRQTISTNRTTKEISESLFVSRKDSKTQHNHAIQLGRAVDYPCKQQLPVEPYLMGVWIGDGARSGGSLSITEMDIVSRLRELGHVVNHQPALDTVWWINSMSGGESLHAILRKRGISGKKEKSIPPEYLRASISDRLLLLQGLMDTDGHVGKGGTCEITTIYRDLSRQIHELVVSLGIKATVIEGVATLNGRYISPKYRVMFTPPEGLEVCFLPRKLDRLRRKRKSDIGRVFVESVRKLENPVPVKCIQVDNSDHLYLAGRNLIPTHNSMMVAIIALYEVYKLIELGDPQAYHEINEGDTIDVLNAATSATVAADSVFDKIKPMVLNSPYFKKKITKESVLKDSIRFFTPHDMEVNEKLRDEGLPAREGTVRALSGHSNSDTLVGKNVIVVIIDEMAGMIQKDKSKMSDAELYEKLKNSVWTFDDPKILCISNPLSKDGKFFDLYERSFTNDNMIMFQLPSYVSNASLTTEDLEEEKRQAMANGSYQDYLMQIEARFSGGAADAFIPAAAIDMSFERGEKLAKRHNGDPRMLYYMHLDPGLNSDYYALVILHAEDDPEKVDEKRRPLKHIVVDHIMLWSKDQVTGSPVDVEAVKTYIIRMCNQFRIVSITFDAWNSADTIQMLMRRGLPARMTPYSPKYQDQIYQNLLDLFLQDRITLYKHGCPFVAEAEDQLKFLEKSYHKKTWTVSAVPGHHDDIPDCLAGAAFLACMGKYGYGGLPKSSTARISWGGLSQVGSMGNSGAGYSRRHR